MIQEMRLKMDEIERLRSDRKQDEREEIIRSKGPQVRLKPRAAAEEEEVTILEENEETDYINITI